MSKKLKEFIKRNKKRNAHLYNEALVEGIDYIVCPVSNERLSVIKSSYIERVLEMSVDDYDTLYPGVRGVSQARKNNIKKGLHEIDPASGKTKYQISQEKARKVLSKKDKNGVTGYKKKGQKTRATHLKNIDETGSNGYSQLAKKAIIKGNLTKAKKGLIVDPTQRDEYYRYKAIILYLTEKERPIITEGYKTGIAGTQGAWQIDHKFSIKDGFKNKISPFVIGHVKNLEMKTWLENLKKNASSDIAKDKLLELCNVSKEQSEKEFDNFLKIIKEEIKLKMPVTAKRVLDIFYETNS